MPSFQDRFDDAWELMLACVTEAIVHLAKLLPNALPEPIAESGFNLTDENDAAKSAEILIEDGAWDLIGEILETADKI